MPAYNAQRTLDETLTSVRAQTYVDIEILIIDDGSQDATLGIALRHAAIDRRIRIFQQENLGVAAARNRGVEEAIGELIAPIDADDLWAPTKLELQISAMINGGPRVGLVYCWYACIDAQSFVTTVIKPALSGYVFPEICASNIVGSGSAPLMRKEFVIAANGYSTKLRAARAQGCEDWLLYARLAERSEFRLVEECLVGYRRIRGTMSDDISQMIDSFQLLSAEMLERHPFIEKHLHWGNVNLRLWLVGNAIRTKRFRDAGQLLQYIAARQPTFFVIEVLKRLAWKLLGFKRRRKFEIGHT
jgi:glycosyltransferase involved in cell wall biosynthesis